MLKDWKPKLMALLLAAIMWYLIQEHLRRRGRIPPVFVPGQVEVIPQQPPALSGTGILATQR